MAIAATAITSSAHAAFFAPYFGGIDPVLAVAVSAVAGSAALAFLRRRGWFEIYAGAATARGIGVSALLATLFAAVVIPVDVAVGFPRDINVPAPWSLLFYPAMGFVAEVWFHAVPLAVLAAPFAVFGKAVSGRALFASMIAVSLLEPSFQVVAGSTRGGLSWLEAFVGVHVFAINLLQLHVFRRYGFVPMYAFRLIYYAYWHVAWGYLRLELIF